MMEYLSISVSFRTLMCITILAFCVDEIPAWPSGAPTSQCGSLMPVHGVEPQSTESPFTITPQYENYGPSTSMQVYLTARAGYSFKGFMIQARLMHTTFPVGIFSDPSDQGTAINCPTGFANTITHINNLEKTSLVVTWTGPNGISGAEVEFVGTFVLNKTTFWTDVKSITLTDACQPSPCQNGGSCFRVYPGSYHCTCVDGFTGSDCSTSSTPAPVHPCMNELEACGNYSINCLFADDAPDSYACQCINGPISINEPCPDPTTAMPTTAALPTTAPVPTTIDPCNSDPCQNGGACIHNSASVIQCYCIGGYTGTYCEIAPPGLCNPSPCQNGGACFLNSDNTDFYCQCVGIYTGPRCEYQVGCASLPCQNNGRCTSTGSYATDYVCDCGSMYSGVNCETEIDPCQSQPCLNGGYCNMRGDSMGYRCTCFNGYSGNNCEIAPPPTTMPPPTTKPTTTMQTTQMPTTQGVVQCNQNCQNGGTCEAGICQCPVGFSGDLCEQDKRPRFNNCPEGETLTYNLEQDSNRATVVLDPITATDAVQQQSLPVVFIVGPDLNSVSMLTFSEAYAAGQPVVAQAVDSENGSRNCSFTVRLVDDQLPTITCPSDIVEITTFSAASVTWPDAVVEDNADPSPTLMYTPAKGSSFQATGEQMSVIARATDSSSNYQECVFQVTVHQRDFDCDPFPNIPNAEVSCQISADGRECLVSCDSGFVNTVGTSNSYTCIADSAGVFWDPAPSDICASAEIGSGISKTATIAFPLTSVPCPTENESFNSAVAANITDTLEVNDLCIVGSASACESESISTECFTNANRRRRSRQGLVLSRKRRDSSTLFIDIDVNSPVSDGADQSQAEGDIDAIVDGIRDVANNEGFELTVNGEITTNSQSDTQVSPEFQWSCDQGQVISSSGCASCPRGTFYDEANNICNFCSRMTYQDRIQQTSCKPCPDGLITDATGSDSEDDCYDPSPSALNLTQTQWILVYIAGAVACSFIILLLVAILICCCRGDSESTPKKGKDVTDNLTYLNRAFEDEEINDEMQYSGTLSRNGTLPMNGHTGNGHVASGDTRLIEIPSDPEYLYAEVPVTSFTSKRNDDYDSIKRRNGHANGHLNTISAAIDMNSIPRPPSLGAPAPPPPPPPTDKPSRIITQAEEFPPPPPNNHHFITKMPMSGDSAPVGPPPPPPVVPPPPPPTGAGAPPPPPPPPVPPNANNSHSGSPSGSTASGRSGRRTKFQI